MFYNFNICILIEKRLHQRALRTLVGWSKQDERITQELSYYETSSIAFPTTWWYNNDAAQGARR